MQLLWVDQAETSENTGYYTQGGMGPWFLHFYTHLHPQPTYSQLPTHKHSASHTVQSCPQTLNSLRIWERD